MFEEKSERFIDEQLDGMKVFDEGDFVSGLQSEIFPFREKQKVSLLQSIKNNVELRKSSHEKVCPHPPEKCHSTKKYKKALEFINLELSDLGALVDEPTDFFGGNSRKSNFTTFENEVLNSKIDEILFQLKKLGLGQEVIFNEIEELKNDALRVTRKDLGLMVIGKIVEFGTTEVAKMSEVQELYNLIKDTVKDLPPFKL